MTEFKHNNITLLNCDCMDYIAAIPDNYFEFAIVDPPYGIGDWTTGQSITKKNGKKIVKENGKWKNVYWNNEIPNINYFNEVIRVSKNQIIWGANYYNCFNKLGGSLIWHKGNINPVFSQCEIASLSFQKKVDYVHINWQAGFARNKEGDTIHPCQKPVKLYEWLLTNYAKLGDKILDTHLGSGSSAIAANNLGFEFFGMELDKDYYDASIKRFTKNVAQSSLFYMHEKIEQLNIQESIF